jgi:uncharacterized GH25 family protein
MKSCSILAVCLAIALPAHAHDTWVQTNTNLIRTGEAVHIDLMLGNHGNDHRDFKLASKLDPSAPGCTLAVLGPDGKSFDLKDRLVDLGYAPKEGFHSAKFAAAKPGFYTVAHTLDRVVNHGKPVRSIKSAKTCFIVSASLDKVAQDIGGFDKQLGHALELVAEANPVAPMGPGRPIKVKLLFQGKPLGGVKVSFVPRGETLAEGFDKTYERTTDADGRATFTPKTGNYYLVVAHHRESSDGKAGYDSIAYSATLTVFVPEVCPCCGE